MSNLNNGSIKWIHHYIRFFDVVSVFVKFVLVFQKTFDRKMWFLESSENSLTEKSIFGHFEVFILNVWTFPRLGVVISCW